MSRNSDFIQKQRWDPVCCVWRIRIPWEGVLWCGMRGSCQQSILAVFVCGMLLVSASAETPSFAEAMRAAQAGELETAEGMLQQIVAEQPGNRAAAVRLEAVRESLSQRRAARERLNRVILPEVNFQDTDFRSAMDFLRQQTQRVTDGQVVLNLVLLAPEPPAVNLRLSQIPLAEAISYLADTAGLRVEFDRNAVRLLPIASKSLLHPLSEKAVPEGIAEPPSTDESDEG